MNLIDELISGQWAEKTAKSLNHEVQFSNLATSHHLYAEFIELYNYLAKCDAWSDEDFDNEDRNAWSKDFKEDPQTTIYCLKLMKRAVDLGREPNHGWLLNL
jgi:hypothetical protein